MPQHHLKIAQMAVTMDESVIIRLAIFIAIFLALMLAEQAFPRRILSTPKRRRRLTNIFLSVINTLTMKLLLPGGLAGIAMWANGHGYGLLQLWRFPSAITLMIGLVLLDFTIYCQHRVFHYIPYLWRLHKVHHSDIDIDVTTAIRFHPLEIMLSALIKLIAIFMIGITAETILVFEIILNGCALFNHSNIRIPPTLDQWLRLFVVTPDMHRVHHSIYPEETNSNYGFNFPWWDRLFYSYHAQPRDGHEAMPIGLQAHRKPLTLLRLLSLPFSQN